MAGHADQGPALRGVVPRFSAGGDPRPADDDQRAGILDVPARRAGHRDGVRPALRAVGVRERHVHRAVDVVVRLLTAGGPVHDLVGDDERARLVSAGQRADGARRQHLADTERAQGPQVGPVRDPVRREPVIPAVPGQERHLPASDLADHDRVAGRAERGLDLDLVAGAQQLVETRPAYDADAGLAGRRAHATFEPVPELVAFSAFLAGFASPDPDLPSGDPELAAAASLLPEELSPEPAGCLSLSLAFDPFRLSVR